MPENAEVDFEVYIRGRIMQNMKKQFISIIIIFSLFLATWALSGFVSQGVSGSQADKSLGTVTQGKEINAEVMKKGINLYMNLSEDKKVAIKEKMVKLSHERQKAITAVEKQIKEYRLQKSKLQQTKSDEAQIGRLQALQQFALKENAPQTAKRFERLINLYENRQFHRSLIENNFKVE
jgi:hypothetical protein